MVFGPRGLKRFASRLPATILPCALGPRGKNATNPHDEILAQLEFPLISGHTCCASARQGSCEAAG